VKRDFTSITDLSREEVLAIFDLARDLKARLKRGDQPPLLRNKIMAMIFEKPSLRTRCTFEVGMYQLGGHAIHLAPSDIGLGSRESIPDIAHNLELWVHLIMARTFLHETVLELARHAAIPVVNGLSDGEHPCQALTDFFTLYEQLGRTEGLHLSYVGDGNNICHSLLLLSGMLGAHLRVATPKGYEPRADVMAKAIELARQRNGSIEVGHDPVETVTDAHVIYTDVWASMGQEREADLRKTAFLSYQVNAELVAHALPEVLIMHDLPAHRGEEITDDILDSSRSLVFRQAENRLHVQKAILVFLARASGVITDSD
jgi:ornithine carbamoyltransferase